MPQTPIVGRFLDELKLRQVPWVPHPALLGFLATTGVRASIPTVAIARVESIEPGEAQTDVEVRLRGGIPRVLLPGENVTVSINRYERFAGFQIKTRALEHLQAARGLWEELPPDSLVVHGQRTYTTHHSPYDLQFFERVPYDELSTTLQGVNHGVIALGPEANVSPRLVFHHEIAGDRLTTYHGDGMAMKTYRNLRQNADAALMILDLESLRGYALVGRCEEVARDENPRATEQIDRGFQALGFGRPNRIFRHRCERFEALDADQLTAQRARAWSLAS